MPDPAADEGLGLAYEERMELRAIQLRSAAKRARHAGLQGVTLPAMTVTAIADMLDTAARRLRQEGA